MSGLMCFIIWGVFFTVTFVTLPSLQLYGTGFIGLCVMFVLIAYTFILFEFRLRGTTTNQSPPIFYDLLYWKHTAGDLYKMRWLRSKIYDLQKNLSNQLIPKSFNSKALGIENQFQSQESITMLTWPQCISIFECIWGKICRIG